MINSIQILPTLCNNNYKFELFPKTNNFDEIYIHKLNEVSIIGNSLYYPNPILYSFLDSKMYNPLIESTMSLRNVKDTINCNLKKPIKSDNVYKDPLFYFIYNTDNYYHFIYDSLPYLISFKKLKETVKNIKLLMYYSKDNMFYKFVKEFLVLLNIQDEDIVIANTEIIYNEIYISSPYTYGSDPKQSPRDDIYDLYKDIVSKVKELKINKSFPKKFYVSRRTWIHNDFSNIGTNYTTRRKCENEDSLVDLLKSHGYEEVFTENLSTIDKILLFNNAESIVGAIGGGIANVLFSNPSCKLITLVSPTFLDVNYRFMYSLNKVNVIYFTDTSHTELGEFKKYMRVQSDNIIGEIEDINDNELLVKYSDQKVTGWNSSVEYKTIKLNKENCRKLDNGLNCSWSLNLDKLKYVL